MTISVRHLSMLVKPLSNPAPLDIISIDLLIRLPMRILSYRATGSCLELLIQTIDLRIYHGNKSCCQLCLKGY